MPANQTVALKIQPRISGFVLICGADIVILVQVYFDTSPTKISDSDFSLCDFFVSKDESISSFVLVFRLNKIVDVSCF